MKVRLEDRVLLAPDTGDDFGNVFVDEGGEVPEEELFFVEGLDENIPDQTVVEEEPEAVRLLREQNEALMTQVSSLKNQADAVTGMQKGIESLGQSLRVPQTQQTQGPVVDPEERKKKFNDEFFNDPYTNMMEFQKEKLVPELQTMLQTNAKYAKKFMLIEPEKAKVYDKYTDEVEAVFKQLPPAKQFQDPDAYKEAVDIVASRHISDTMEDMKAQIRAELMAELQGGKATPARQVPHNETGVSGGNRKGGVAKVLPKQVWDFAGIKGLQGRGEKEDRARVYKSWKEGKLNVPGMAS